MAIDEVGGEVVRCCDCCCEDGGGVDVDCGIYGLVVVVITTTSRAMRRA